MTSGIRNKEQRVVLWNHDKERTDRKGGPSGLLMEFTDDDVRERRILSDLRNTTVEEDGMRLAGEAKRITHPVLKLSGCGERACQGDSASGGVHKKVEGGFWE